MKKAVFVIFTIVILAVASLVAYHFYMEAKADEELAKLNEARAKEEKTLSKEPEEQAQEYKKDFEETSQGKSSKSFASLYREQPSVFITADAAYELFRNYYERAADGVYGTFLYDQYASLFIDLVESLEERYEATEGSDRMAARNALRFASVCMKICLPESRVPAAVLREVEDEVNAVKEATFIGEKDGQLRDYTVYAPFKEKADTPWGSAALLRAYLGNNYFSITEEETFDCLSILADALFKSEISSENYREAVKYLKAFDGEANVMTVKEFYEAQKGSDEEKKALLQKAKTSFEQPPWKDPVHIGEPTSRVFFLPPPAALPERTFRELHRWVVPPKVKHILYVLGAAEDIPEAEAALLKDLREELQGHLGLSERAVASAANLKNKAQDLPAACWIRSAVYSVEKPEEIREERDWPKIETVKVEKEAEFYRALAGLVRELNELYTELDLYRVMSSYKKTPLTPDHLLEVEQIFLDLADMSKEGENDSERALMTARRFLTLLASGKNTDTVWDKETTLGLEYNFLLKTVVGLNMPEQTLVTFPKEDNASYHGVRYRIFEKEERVKEAK
ncbi:DUF3160 domain-containing protein [bacterium]|nr:DUF3160 domain-containing protein [bacterium]